MFTRQVWIALLLAGGLAAVAGAAHYRITRPQMRCAIPDRDYQFKTMSQPRRSVSAVGVALPRVGEAKGDLTQPAHQVKLFQFKPPTLTIDHCSLSRMAVLLHANGDFSVSLQADQNSVARAGAAPNVTSAEPRGKAAGHLQRNEFHVQVRCYGRGGPPAGRPLPVLIPLDLHPFWVQRGVPYPYFVRGNDRRIADSYNLIDRIEIEFAYRLD